MSIKNVSLRPWFTACSVPGWERPEDKGVFFLWYTVGTQDRPSSHKWDLLVPATGSHTVELASAALSWINVASTWQSETRKITPRTPYLPLSISGLFRFPLWNTHGQEVESITLMEREFWAQHHTDRGRILSPSLGGSWSSAFMLGPLPLLVRVCAEVSPSSFDMYSTTAATTPEIHRLERRN